jgi:hypothetical protein
MKARGGRRRLSPKRLSSSSSPPPMSPPAATIHPPSSDVVVSTSYAEMDAAYFHSYAHVGIHEEMIKVDACIAFLFGRHYTSVQSSVETFDSFLSFFV